MLTGPFLVSALAVLVSQAPDVDAQLDQARRAYEDLEYEQVAHDMMLVGMRDDATEAQRIEANLLAGMANVIMEQEVRARLNFRYVLTRDPDATLPDETSPKVQSFFALVREEVRQEKAAGGARAPRGDEPAAGPDREDSGASGATASPSTPAIGGERTDSATQGADRASTDDAGFPWLLTVGTLTAGSGLLMIGLSLGAAVLTELAYADVNGNSALRDATLFVGPVLWGSFFVAIGASVLGVGLTVWGLLE